MENIIEFTDGLPSELMQSEAWYETVTSGELQYLKVVDLVPNTITETCSQGIFIGFATAGAAIIISLGIAAIIRIFRAA